METLPTTLKMSATPATPVAPTPPAAKELASYEYLLTFLLEMSRRIVEEKHLDDDIESHDELLAEMLDVLEMWYLQHDPAPPHEAGGPA